MERLQLENLTKAFLAAYEAKDLNAISSQLADSVVIRDWNLEVVGKSRVLKEFSKNFDSAKSLSIQVRQLLSSESTVAAEVEITVNDAELLRVVDVLSFETNGEIASIISYKGL